MPRFDFVNSIGLRLSGELELPAATPMAYAIFAHCFTCSKNYHAPRRIARTLAKHGIAVLRFDFTGLGDSEGDFIDTNFSSNVDDIRSAAEALSRKHSPPSLLIGHSLGGAATLFAADIPSVQAIVAIAAPSEPAHLTELLSGQLEDIREDETRQIRIAGREFSVNGAFVCDLLSNRLTETAKDLSKPLLIFHSPTDEIVPLQHAHDIFSVASHPKSFVAVDGADHLLSRSEDAVFVANTLATWANRYIAPFEEPPAPSISEGDYYTVEVTEHDGGLAQRVIAGNHALAADEPTSAGGTDTGPDPYGYLLSALGACTSMTLRMYANRKQWPLDAIRVRLRHSRIHAEDCANCEANQRLVDHIDREIEIGGSLDQGQLGRLGEIANRCPVHRTLTSETAINTRVSTANIRGPTE